MSFLNSFIISRIVLLVFYIIIIAILYKNTRELILRHFRSIYLSLMLGVVFNIGVILNDYLRFISVYSETTRMNFMVFSVLDLVFLFQFIFLFVFVERIRNPSISSSKWILMTSIVMVNVTSNLLLILNGYDQVVLTLTQIPFNAIIAAAFTFISMSYYQIYKEQANNLVLTQLIASIILAVSNYLQMGDIYKIFYYSGMIEVSSAFISFWEGFSSFNLIVVQPLILFIFVIAILNDVEIIYRTSSLIQQIIVFQTSGVSLFSIGKIREDDTLDQQLFAGFASALNNFMNELASQEDTANIDLMQSTTHAIDLKFGEELAIAVVTKQRSYYIEKLLEPMIIAMEDDPEIQDNLKSSTSLDPERMKQLIKIHLPYLNLTTMQVY